MYKESIVNSFVFLLLTTQSTAIGHRGVRLNLVLKPAEEDKRHKQDRAQTQHRNIMELIVKEVHQEQALAIQKPVQVL